MTAKAFTTEDTEEQGGIARIAAIAKK